MIYRCLFALYELPYIPHNLRRWPPLQGQPAITRVSRQLRTEALPLYYERPKTLRIHTNTPEEWAQSVEGVIHAFTGKSGRQGNSTLRHVTALSLELFVEDIPFLWMDVAMMSDPEDMTAAVGGVGPQGVMVGIPDMDWADAKAVRAAGKNAETRPNKLQKEAFVSLKREVERHRRRFPEYMGFTLPSRPADYMAVVDVMCVVASACPHLTRAVSIADLST